MTLIRRVSRLLRADLNAVLDQLEEPDALLRQSIREMEQTLLEDEDRYARLLQRQQQIRRSERELTKSLEGSQQELDLCFENGADSLAKNLLRRRLESEKRLELLNAKRAEFEQDAAQLQQRIADNRARLQQTRQQAELVLAEQAVEHTEPRAYGAEALIDDQQVELAWLRERRERGLS